MNICQCIFSLSLLAIGLNGLRCAVKIYEADPEVQAERVRQHQHEGDPFW